MSAIISRLRLFPAGRRCVPLEYIFAFIISVLAGIVSYYICKWLDGDDT